MDDRGARNIASLPDPSNVASLPQGTFSIGLPFVPGSMIFQGRVFQMKNPSFSTD
jgi:hypothetical protein